MYSRLIKKLEKIFKDGRKWCLCLSFQSHCVEHFYCKTVRNEKDHWFKDTWQELKIIKTIDFNFNIPNIAECFTKSVNFYFKLRHDYRCLYLYFNKRQFIRGEISFHDSFQSCGIFLLVEMKMNGEIKTWNLRDSEISLCTGGSLARNQERVSSWWRDKGRAEEEARIRVLDGDYSISSRQFPINLLSARHAFVSRGSVSERERERERERDRERSRIWGRDCISGNPLRREI